MSQGPPRSPTWARATHTIPALLSATVIAVASCGVAAPPVDGAAGTAAQPPSRADGAHAEIRTPIGLPDGLQSATVERVRDGDTIRVRTNDPGGALQRDEVHVVQLLHVDTPESVAPGKPVQCGGLEASAYTKSLLPRNTAVYLERDAVDVDKYGRHLRHVWLPDGTMVNQAILRAGLGRFLAQEGNSLRAIELRVAETEARSNRAGIWGTCTEQATPPALPHRRAGRRRGTRPATWTGRSTPDGGAGP